MRHFFVAATLLISLAINFSTLDGQETRQVLIEEVQAFPESMQGEWTIGGKEFSIDAETVLHRQTPFKKGCLAALEYIVLDGESNVVQIAALPFRADEINDGPYVMWKSKSTAEVITIEKGLKKVELLENLDQSDEIVRDSFVVTPGGYSPPKCEWEMPKRLLAISDLEGNFDNAFEFLCNNKVIDENGKWIWGDGHLVLIGDLVDRGSKVTELMWLLRRLEREAAAVDGRVHYVLGNHEAMVMAGDLRYVHPKYRFTSERIGRSYDELFGPKSEIGRWWRSRNGVVRIGNLLFIHGGYSPELDRANLDLETLNQRIRAGLPPAIPKGTTVETNPVAHKFGPFWYRGYFDRHALEWGGKATEDEINRMLERHKTDYVVIGHTLVNQVGPLDESKSVIAIDVEWTTPSKCQGLLVEDGKLFRLKMSGARESIGVARD